MKNFQYYLEMSQKSEIAETPKSKIKPGSEIDFQNIPAIKNFIETNSYNLTINKPLGIRMTTGGGIQWGLENKIYGNKDDIDKLMIDLKKGIEIQLKGPGNSIPTEAFMCGKFIFQKDPVLNSIYFIGIGRLKNNPEIWK